MGLGLGGAGITSFGSAVFWAVRHAGTWEAALLGCSFFDIGRIRRGPESSSGSLPHIVVVEELRNIAAPVEQGGQSDRQDDRQLYNRFL